MQTAPDRKLTTILAADVAGYSALMERDEAGTLALLKASRETMAREIAAYRGRIVSTAGDGLLAEFGSVVNAVDCAVRMQRHLAERNAGLSEMSRMRFRIGINLGDVMVDGEDLLGDGVNVAARLQALAEPGGILISGPVFDQVRTKLALGFDFLGPQAVKNISEPVPAWRVVLDGDAGGERNPPPLRGRMAAEQPGLRRAEAASATQAGEGEAAASQTAKGLHRTLAFEPPSDSARLARPPLTPSQRLKRRAAISAVLIAMFFAINMLTDSNSLWFQWPTLGILAVLALRTAWTMGR